MADETFKTLNAIDVNNHVEKKNGLTYLSWAWAWSEVKKAYPNASYKIKRHPETNLPYWYDEKTGYMVFTEVTINNLTHEMWLPVMDNNNKAMKSEMYKYSVKGVQKVVQPATMFDVNKAIMRCLVKNLAMFGLGLYIYAGEDLPEYICEECGQAITPRWNMTPSEIAAKSKEATGKQLCGDCMLKAKKEMDDKKQ